MALFNLLQYQKDWLLDKSRFKIAMQARQTGKTFINTLEIVDDIYQSQVVGKKTNWVILSRGERQALEAMEVVRQHAKAYQFTLENEINTDIEVRYRVSDLMLSGGSRVIAIPANPDTARGFSANVFLDEFAFHQDSTKIWQSLFPVISAGYKMRIASTPNGKNNKFYDLMTQDNHIWSKHFIDIYTAVNHGLDRNIDELRLAIDDDISWSQEFELDWLDENFAWLSYSLIESCQNQFSGMPENYAGNPTFIGIDIARKNDLWVAIVLEKISGIAYIREIITVRNKTYDYHTQTVNELIQKYKPKLIYADCTGMGEPIIENWIKLYGSVIKGITFTAKSKHTMATILKNAFENKMIQIPIDNKLKHDLHKVQRIISPTGIIKFDAIRDTTGHSDRFWALSLAMYAFSDYNKVVRSPIPSFSCSW